MHIKVIEAFDAFMEKINAGAPTEMGGMIHGGGVFWTWTWTERALVDGIFTGFAIWCVQRLTRSA